VHYGMDPDKVFSSLTKKTLSDIVQLHFTDLDDQHLLTAKRQNQIDALVEDVVYSGIGQLVRTVTLPTLKAIAYGVDMSDYEKPGRVAYQKGLTEHIDDEGVEEYLEGLKTDLLNLVAKELEVGNKVPNIVDWVNQHGLQSFFRQFAEGELNQWLSDSGIEVPQTRGKNYLVSAITQQKAPKTKKKIVTPKPDMNVEERPALKKGITHANVFQHYKRAEMVEFLKSKGVAHNGTLQVLSRRVAAVLDGKYVAPVPKKRGRAAASEKKERPAKKQKSKASSVNLLKVNSING